LQVKRHLKNIKPLHFKIHSNCCFVVTVKYLVAESVIKQQFFLVKSCEFKLHLYHFRIKGKEFSKEEPGLFFLGHGDRGLNTSDLLPWIRLIKLKLGMGTIFQWILQQYINFPCLFLNNKLYFTSSRLTWPTVLHESLNRFLVYFPYYVRKVWFQILCRCPPPLLIFNQFVNLYEILNVIPLEATAHLSFSSLTILSWQQCKRLRCIQHLVPFNVWSWNFVWWHVLQK
jgi:hypothetical protein